MPEAQPATTPTSARNGPPLVVDVDGTLLRGDLFLEGLVQLATTRPLYLIGALTAWRRGRAAAKAFVAREASLDLDMLPLEPQVVALIEAAQATDRHVVLASGAAASQVAALGRRLSIHDTMGSDDTVNLTHERKLARLRERFQAFDYIGNSRADLPLWVAGREATAVNPTPLTHAHARRLRPDLQVLRTPGTWRAWWRALRPHQWSKNALIFLPALAAHLPLDGPILGTLALGFLAFSCVASAVYILNDLADLRHDRGHPTNRHRPLAAGRISIPGALAAAMGLLLAGALLSATLPATFQAILATYFLATSAYSFGLKRRLLADVMTLTVLYTLRVLGGAAIVAVELSQWFLAFSVFFFLSLALLKRVVELDQQPVEEDSALRPRGYLTRDIPILTSFGAAAAGASALVYCLYITSDTVNILYRAPERLWAGLLLLLYWQARAWVLAGRGRMPSDPVRFALRDRISYLALAAFLLTIIVAR